MQSIPVHIAIIPDGNRRWAKGKGFPTLLGHKKGFDRTLEIIKHARHLGVKVITFYGFSRENWSRPQKEVGYLMNLFISAFDRYMNKFHRLGIKFRHLGNPDLLSAEANKKLQAGMELTKENDGLIVQLAINYTGREELNRAIQEIAKEKIKPEKITPEMIESHLDTAGIPEPDLIIRTSGEQRLSGFLLWQAAYAELFFSPKLWPDFSKDDLDSAIAEFTARQRRFGS